MSRNSAPNGAVFMVHGPNQPGKAPPGVPPNRNPGTPQVRADIDRAHHTRTLVDPGPAPGGPLDPHSTGHGTRVGRHPGLRLVRTELSPESNSRHTRPLRAKLANEVGTENRRSAALSDGDARRIMARRVAESIDGGRAGILVPERRRALVSTAERMGMRPFDANLIIAVVQDRFRRGLFGSAGAGRDERLELISAPYPAGAPRRDDDTDAMPHPALFERRRERFWLAVRLFLASAAIAGILTVWLVNWMTGNLP